jgi:hypothetical protein
LKFKPFVSYLSSHEVGAPPPPKPLFFYIKLAAKLQHFKAFLKALKVDDNEK